MESEIHPLIVPESAARAATAAKAETTTTKATTRFNSHLLGEVLIVLIITHQVESEQDELAQDFC
jgi:hypothetical protein